MTSLFSHQVSVSCRRCCSHYFWPLQWLQIHSPPKFGSFWIHLMLMPCLTIYLCSYLRFSEQQGVSFCVKSSMVLNLFYRFEYLGSSWNPIYQTRQFMHHSALLHLPPIIAMNVSKLVIWWMLLLELMSAAWTCQWSPMTCWYTQVQIF